MSDLKTAKPDERGIMDHGGPTMLRVKEFNWVGYGLVTHYMLVGSKRTLLEFSIFEDGHREGNLGRLALGF